MIKKILHQLSIGYQQSEDRINAMKHYGNMMEHPGWKTHEQFLLEITNALNHYVFSEQFTKLDPETKDIEQRVLFHLREVMQFLVNPLRGANINAAIQKHNKRMEKQPKKRPAGK